MKIETKFDVGDIVFRLSYDVMFDEFRLYSGYEITKIINDTFLQLDNSSRFYPMTVCFKIKEEGQAECDRRNKHA